MYHFRQVGEGCTGITEDRLRAGMAVTIVPLVNPAGYLAGTRENGDDLDLNREFDSLDSCADEPDEVKAIRKTLVEHEYHLGLDFHSAISTGPRSATSIARFRAIRLPPCSAAARPAW